jgi:hypothetical protein
MTFYKVIAASGTPHVFYTENGGKYQSKSTPGRGAGRSCQFEVVDPNCAV